MDSTLACLAAWMPRQRWYAAKGRTPTLRLVAWWDLPALLQTPDAAWHATPEIQVESLDARVRIRTYLVADEGALPAVLYQVPVVARETSTVTAAAAHIIGSPEPGTTLIDGPHDPAYAAALRRLVTRGGDARGRSAQAIGHPAASAPHTADRSTASVLSGEQSNTSLIYLPSGDGVGGTDGVPMIAKVFRQVHAGLNPDIELQIALADAGSPYVPAAIGSVEGEWPDIADPVRPARGSLVFAQQFLPGVEDAWRVALRAAASGDDFAARSAALGAATAEVHLSLAELFPTRPTTDADHAVTRASWMRRLLTAIAEVPGLAAHRSAIEDVYARATSVPWPHVQRVHGDYHLGQVILVPGHGWVLLDFEGEPMRPMAERVQLDLALRDVAGMLRSFDYVAGSIRLDQPDRSSESVSHWARAARTAFLEGYERTSDTDLRALRPLLDALELDKAVYEAIYEARNRPTWIAIPLRAITRLVAPPTH